MIFGDYLEYFFPLLLPNKTNKAPAYAAYQELMYLYFLFSNMYNFYSTVYEQKFYLNPATYTVDHDLQQSSCFQPCLRPIPQRVKLCLRERRMSSNL